MTMPNPHLQKEKPAQAALLDEPTPTPPVHINPTHLIPTIESWCEPQAVPIDGNDDDDKGSPDDPLAPAVFTPVANNEPRCVVTIPYHADGQFLNVTIRTGFTPEMIQETVLHYRAAVRALQKGTPIETMAQHGFDKRSTYPMHTGDARVLCYGSVTIKHGEQSQMVNINKLHEGTTAVEVVQTIRTALAALSITLDDDTTAPSPTTLKPKED